MNKAKDFARENAQSFLEDLLAFLRFPSVSTDPAYAKDVAKTAEWLRDDMEKSGIKAEVIPTAKHPLVYGEWLEAGDDAVTVLIYGHYDVQPAVKEDGWDSEPFEPVIKDGKIYARGATDDKGQMLCHVKAVQAILASEGRLPVNVKFIIEGEEESGGGSIAAYVKEQGERLSADVCLVSDTSMGHIDHPTIINSLRGVLAMDLLITGPKQDLHSGMFGGSVHNPAQAMTEILSKLHDEKSGEVSVPGFYDQVVPLSEADREEMAKAPLELAEWKENTGAPKPWGESQYTLRERVSARPTLEITGMASGYFGEGRKNIVPQKAWAKLSCRLVANQDANHTFDLIDKYMQSISPDTVRVQLEKKETHPAILIDINNPYMEAAKRAYQKGWGAEAIFVREGGSIPIVSEFQNRLKLPIVMMGFGLNSDGLHGPNEHFHINMFHKGIETSIQFLYELANMEDKS
ncbi:dipeptidase [Anaerolineales bacterium]